MKESWGDIMTIYVTGDIHGDIDIGKLHANRFKEGNQLTKDDYLIICGDFGLVFDPYETKSERYMLKWLNEKPWTTLFVDGNHENFDRLEYYPQKELFGGKVHEIMPSIFHLMRGEIYTIDDKKLFCFGGAFSHDRQYRTIHKSWWPQELPTIDECNHARKNLEKLDQKVDLIITHDAPGCVARRFGFNRQAMQNGYNDNQVNILDFLQEIYKTVEFKEWYCGHYHMDIDDDNFHFLYNRVLKVK